jgi:hypothetical protein
MSEGGGKDAEEVKKFIFAVITLLPVLVSAQEMSVRCSFSDGFSTNFDSGKPSSKRTLVITDAIIFDRIDTRKRTARMVGNAGASDVQVIETERGLHLIELTVAGNLNITTLFTNTKDKNTIPAVHSRHLSVREDAIPSQSVGLCKRMN